MDAPASNIEQKSVSPFFHGVASCEQHFNQDYSGNMFGMRTAGMVLTHNQLR